MQANKETEEYFEKLLNKFKQDPQYELKQELGMFCMRHINSLTPEEKKRYDEILELLKNTTTMKQETPEGEPIECDSVKLKDAFKAAVIVGFLMGVIFTLIVIAVIKYAY